MLNITFPPGPLAIPSADLLRLFSPVDRYAVALGRSLMPPQFILDGVRRDASIGQAVLRQVGGASI